MNSRVLVAVATVCLMAIGSLASAASWIDNFDTGYVTGDLVGSPWVQQANDGITNGVGVGRDLTIWVGGYSYPNCVYFPAWDLGLVSRATGAGPTDTNVVAQMALVRYGQERSFFVLSSQNDCNGTKWMNVPGSIVMETNGHWGTIDLTSVNSLGVASTVQVTGYAPEAAWTLWRFVAPKASGAQTVSLDRNTGSGWSTIASIGVDSSFNASYLGFGSYWTAGADDVSFSSTAVPEPGSMLALAGGLVSLIGFGVRRRK